MVPASFQLFPLSAKHGVAECALAAETTANACRFFGISLDNDYKRLI